MKFDKFADLHCHPHLRSFNWLRGTRYEKRPGLRKKYFHPWFIVWSNIRAKEKGKRANAYSQSDLIRLTNGNVKLVWVALYPMEKGWFKKHKNEIEQLLQVRNTIKNTHPENENNPEFLEKEITSLRDLIQSFYMRIPKRRINYFQGENYDYFDELNREKDFIIERNLIKSKSAIYFPSLVRKIFTNKKKLEKSIEYNATGTYELALKGKDISEIISNDRTAFVFNIEGVNVFDTGDKNIDNIIRRIDEVKNWKYKPSADSDVIHIPVFSISLAHHYSNSLCGHCRSIPDIAKILFDQTESLNIGFRDKGKLIIRYLLGLDMENNIEPDFGRRILIDVKHMSARSRQYYYDEIIHPCRDKGDYIPVISSHTGYSGRKTINELIHYSPDERDRDCFYTPEKPFNTWSINLCDEDIIEIFKSGGIIGINLDQRILGMARKKKSGHYSKDYDISFFWRNLKAMMDAVIDNHEPDMPPKSTVTKLFGLGSDFDGYIDPLDKYPTSLEFGKLAKNLCEEVKKDPFSDKYLFGLSAEKFVNQIVFENALDFTIKNLK